MVWLNSITDSVLALHDARVPNWQIARQLGLTTDRVNKIVAYYTPGDELRRHERDMAMASRQLLTALRRTRPEGHAA
jgi:hypothetical protein